jgi:hypothetical protein
MSPDRVESTQALLTLPAGAKSTDRYVAGRRRTMPN